MKLKYFLRGLGTGILFSTVILMLTFRLSPSQKMSKEEIISEAEKYGMVEKDSLDEDLNQLKQTLVPQPEETITPSEAPKKETEQPAAEQTPEPMEEEIGVEVEAGMYGNKVAQALKDKGLVDSVEEFNNYLIEHGYQSKIKIGVHKIPKGSSYKEIAEIISK